MKTPPRYAIFPNGTSHMSWLARNCDRCLKAFNEDTSVDGTNPLCPIETAISMASATDGTLLHGGDTPLNKAAALSQRLNWDGETYLEHDCPEFVP